LKLERPFNLAVGFTAADDELPAFSLMSHWRRRIEPRVSTFLFDASTYAQLGAAAKQQLGFRADVFGVLSGLLPHPAELVLQTIEEAEAPGPEGEEGHRERS
jgi:hypothetical protein